MFTTYLCSPGDVHVDIFASFVLHDEGWVWLLWKKWDLVLVKTTPCTLYRLAKVQNHKQGVNFSQILKYLLLLFTPWPWCPPLRRCWTTYWPWNKSRFDIIISGKEEWVWEETHLVYVPPVLQVLSRVFQELVFLLFLVKEVKTCLSKFAKGSSFSRCPKG